MDVGETPAVLRSRAVTIRGYARKLSYDRAGRTLLELADELDLRANEIEAKEAARQRREASRQRGMGLFRLLLTNARRATVGRQFR